MWQQLLHQQTQHASNFCISQFKTYSWLGAICFRGSVADVFIRAQCFLAQQVAINCNASSVHVFHLQMQRPFHFNQALTTHCGCNFCRLRCSKTNTNLSSLLHNFTHVRFVLTTDLSNLSM